MVLESNGRNRSNSNATDHSKESEEPEIDIEKVSQHSLLSSANLCSFALQLRSVYLNSDLNRRARYPNNAINNCKYSWYSFVPVVLYNQFKYFFNLFFLVIALSQIVPALRVGFLISFVAPLVFVLAVTMIKEFYDDRSRYFKDNEINVTPY